MAEPNFPADALTIIDWARGATVLTDELRAELRTWLDHFDPQPPTPDPPEDRTDLVALGRWVADCLDETNHLVWRTVVRHLVDEVEQLRGCATHGTVDAATLSEREPRPIPAWDCDQEPYQ